jgi:pimeloyl-ACP methyl ester carboxylesterase
MTTIHLLHGIHTKPGSRRLQDLVPIVVEASGRPVVYHEYGDIWAIQTRWKNPGIARRLVKLIQPGDILVGHSNGAAIWMRALMEGAPARGLVLLNPALDDETDFSVAPHLEWIHVYYNDDDEWVPWAARAPKWLLDPLWGDMGRDGYRGTDWRVLQTDCEHTIGMPSLRGHGAILEPTAAYTWARHWGAKIRI